MVRRDVLHQNQTPGLTQTLQIIPAVKPCWTRSKHTASGLCHPAWRPTIFYLHWLEACRCTVVRRRKQLGFLLKTPFSCLTLSLLLTAHQGSRAESGRDLSSHDFYSCFCLRTHFSNTVEVLQKTWQRPMTAGSLTGLL